MKLSLKLAGIYAAMLLLFLSSLFLAHLIPNSAINDNIHKSVESLNQEGVYPNILNFKLFQLDNYTETLMLNISASADTDSPLDASLLNHWHTSGVGRSIITDTKAYLNHTGDSLEQRMYGRYWHGYLSYLRPMLVIMDYSKIRIVNYIVLIGLLVLNCILIVKKFNTNILLVFLASLLLVGLPVVPMSLFFSSTFCIAFIANIYILRKESSLDRNACILLFFIIGGVTSFFDLLSTPQVTLGLPLTFLLLINDHSNKYVKIVVSSLSWAMGYALIWFSKWLFGTLITGVDIFHSAFNYVEMRTSNVYSGMEMTPVQIVKYSFSLLDQLNLAAIFTGLIALVIAVYFLLVKSRKSVIENAHFLLIALMVPTWYLLLTNHSIQHGWFTWRASVVSLFSIFIFVMMTTDLSKISKILPSRSKAQGG